MKSKRTSSRGRRRSGRSRTGTSTRTRRSNGGVRRRSSGDGAPSSWSRHGTALPSWADLEPPTNKHHPHPSDGTFLEEVSTVRFAAIVLLLAGAFTLYVGHVHATKDLLGKVQTVRAENQRLHLKHNRLKGAFARRTSPSVIYERARALGLQESVTYGPTVSTDE